MFKKDLLILDIEATGVDIRKHEMIQLAGVLLDKKTLKEKKHFTSYIKPLKWRNRDPEAMAVCNISWEDVKDAPDLKTVLKNFVKAFGTDVTPVHYGGNLDVIFFPGSFQKVDMKYPYDYHTMNLWVLAYYYAAKNKKLSERKKFHGFSMDKLTTDFGIVPPTDRHDALADCRLEADLLRHLIKNL